MTAFKDSVSIVLASGEVFTGKRFGASVDTIGELVFTTGMGGYIETLTDPSYYGQIVMQTFPAIGNYGMISADFESDRSVVRGYVCYDPCETPSNFRSETTVDCFLKEHGIPGVCGIDTRQLTRLIRAHGVMNAAIVSDSSLANFDALRSYRVADAVKAVTSSGIQVLDPDSPVCATVVLIDYGAKRHIEHALLACGCRVISVPARTPAEEILALHPDGILLSNGPGDPAENTECIAELAKLLGKCPIFGICLGHQLLALAAGGRTEKLKYGHRGTNQPVKNLETGRVFISSQNHGYAVLADSLSTFGAVQWFVNANDGTCEGMVYPEIHAASVQFHPEACAGPKDTGSLFRQFVSSIVTR